MLKIIKFRTISTHFGIFSKGEMVNVEGSKIPVILKEIRVHEEEQIWEAEVERTDDNRHTYVPLGSLRKFRW